MLETSPLICRLCDVILKQESFATPEEMIDAIDTIVSEECDLHYTGYMVLPLNLNDIFVNPGKYAVLSPKLPKGWAEEWSKVTEGLPDLTLVRALTQPHAVTDSEVLRDIQPTGREADAIHMKYKYGIRDRLIMAVGGRWIFGFWSPKVIKLTNAEKYSIHMAAAAACHTLYRHGRCYDLGLLQSFTKRELASLRMASMGKTTKEIGAELAVSEETVKTHLTNVRRKLGASNVTGAVATALRNRIIS